MGNNTQKIGILLLSAASSLFLYNFSQTASPVIVTIVSAIIMGVLITFIVRKKILKNFVNLVKNK